MKKTEILEFFYILGFMILVTIIVNFNSCKNIVSKETIPETQQRETNQIVQPEKVKSNVQYIGKIDNGVSAYYISKIKVDSSEYIIVSGYSSVAIAKHK